MLSTVFLISTINSIQASLPMLTVLHQKVENSYLGIQKFLIDMKNNEDLLFKRRVQFRE